jgi:beta-hydroxylase
MFSDPAEFDFIRPLADHWLDVRREFDALPDDVLGPWHDRHLYNAGGWKTFGLYAFGWRIDENCALCPHTARLVETIPGLQTAGFSHLGPHAHIRPHRGLERGVLRCHVGLHVPDGCALRVGDETRRWQEGGSLVFDDTSEHEAWNRSDAGRVVLLLDFKREPNAFHPSYALLDWVDRTRFRFLARWRRRAT